MATTREVIPIRPAGETGAPSRQRRRAHPKGRSADPALMAELLGWLGGTVPERSRLIEALHLVNDRLGQLPAPHLVALAALMKLPMTEVHEVASFYHHFEVVKEDGDGRIAEPPLFTVRVCDGIACELAGAAGLLADVQALVQAQVQTQGQRNPGPRVRVVAAPCIGRCEAAPAAVVHQRPVLRADAATLGAAIEAARAEPALRLDVSPPAAQRYTAYRQDGGYALLRACVDGPLSVDSVITALEHAGLRGLGGAGFPAGRKWRLVKAQPAPRLMAVNIDEGEPGTFKDRHYLERDPHRFLEGLLIAAWAVGIEAVWIYLRDEYHGCRQLLQDELDALQGEPPVPNMPRIELRRGAGAYICGEESAMIESIEGKRGLPRLRPPYVAEVGLFGRPTLEHNFETLYWVRDIVQRGAAWFAGHGRHGRQGLRSFSVSGRVREPGVKLAPAGITLNELIAEHCGGLLPGHRLYGYLPGGASGGILPASLADVPLDFDTLQPHGAFIGSAAIVVLTESATHCDRASDVARNLMRFFEHESCGQCTPCRVGTAKASGLIATDAWDTALLAELSQVMRDASICGLGQAAPNPVDHVMRYFAHELQSAAGEHT